MKHFPYLLFLFALLNTNTAFPQNINLGTLPKITSDGTIERVIPMANGQYIIKGAFDFIQGKPISRIARLNNDGSLDETFTTSLGFDNTIYDVLVADNGEVFLAMFTTAAEYRVIKLKNDGAVDDGFVFIANQQIISIAWHSGNILVGGSFSEVNETPVAKLVSVATNGSLNTAFNSNVTVNFNVNKINKQGDKIILIERFGDSIARLNSDGTSDNSFLFDIVDVNSALGTSFHQYDFLVVTDDQVIVNDLFEGILFFDFDGNFLEYTDNYKFFTTMTWGNDEVWFALQFDEIKSDVFKYLPDTKIFEPVGSGNGPIHDIVFNGSNEVVLGGNFNEFSSTPTSSLIKLDVMNDPVQNFEVEEFYNNGSISAIALHGADKILIGGKLQ